MAQRSAAGSAARRCTPTARAAAPAHLPAPTRLPRVQASAGGLPETYNGCATLYELFNKAVEEHGENRWVAVCTRCLQHFAAPQQRQMPGWPARSGFPGPLALQVPGLAPNWRGRLRRTLPVPDL